MISKDEPLHESVGRDGVGKRGRWGEMDEEKMNKVGFVDLTAED
jgi:hypothetical protein